LTELARAAVDTVTELRIGVAARPGAAVGVLVDGADRIRRRSERFGTGASPVAEVVCALAGAASGPVGRVVVSVPVPADPRRLLGRMCRVGALRIGAPATSSVPPFTGWPTPLVERVRGPIALVRGGHEYDGAELAPLDLDAVRGFGDRCRATGVAAVAVNGINAQLSPSHELAAAGLLGDLLGPAVPIITGHEVGGAGLLERENTALLDAGLAPSAHRFTEELGRSLADGGVDADLYLLGGDGTVLPADRVARHPLHLLDSAHGAARSGAAHLTGRRTLVVAQRRGGRVLVSGQLDGLPVRSGLPLEIGSVRTSLRAVRREEFPRGPGPAGASRLANAVDRLGGGLAAAPLVLVGVGADGLAPMSGRPVLVLPDDAIPPADPAEAGGAALSEGALVAAFGAASGEAAGTVDRLFWFGAGGVAGGLAECVATARRLASEAAIRSGADPARLRIGEVREELMTYVPVPGVRLRVTVTAPLLGTARPDR
jgi:hypothetical protein